MNQFMLVIFLMNIRFIMLGMPTNIRNLPEFFDIPLLFCLPHAIYFLERCRLRVSR